MPHSLSYQDTSFTKLSLSEMPAEMSTTDEVLQDTKSVDTTSSSVYPRMPFIGPSASALIAATISLMGAAFSMRTVKSTTDIWRWHAEGHARELAVQFWDDLAHCLGGARG